MTDEQRFLMRFRKLLDNEDVSLDTLLIDLYSYDSVARMGFIAMAGEDYGVDLDYADVFTARTVRELYNLVKGR